MQSICFADERGVEETKTTHFPVLGWSSVSARHPGKDNRMIYRRDSAPTLRIQRKLQGAVNCPMTAGQNPLQIARSPEHVPKATSRKQVGALGKSQ